MKRREVLIYAATHPGEAVKTLVSAPIRQILVRYDLGMPPAGSTFEDFPNLPLFQAIGTTLEAQAMEHQRKKKGKDTNMTMINRSTLEQRREHINNLKHLVLTGGQGSEWALGELSGAAPDNPEAREAIAEIDEALKNG